MIFRPWCGGSSAAAAACGCAAIAIAGRSPLAAGAAAGAGATAAGAGDGAGAADETPLTVPDCSCASACRSSIGDRKRAFGSRASALAMTASTAGGASVPWLADFAFGDGSRPVSTSNRITPSE